MAETVSAPAYDPDGALRTAGREPAAPDERGTLDVRSKALTHIVETCALRAPGTVARHRALGRLVGGDLPRATVSMTGGSARVDVEVAALWPCRAAEIATGVRDSVLADAERLSGVLVRSVDVTLHVVDATSDDERRRVQ